MTCNNCVNHVETALSNIDGVLEVEVNLAGAKATINTNGTPSQETLESAVTNAGYSIHEPGADLGLLQVDSVPKDEFNWNDGNSNKGFFGWDSSESKFLFYSNFDNNNNVIGNAKINNLDLTDSILIEQNATIKTLNKENAIVFTDSNGTLKNQATLTYDGTTVKVNQSGEKALDVIGSVDISENINITGSTKISTLNVDNGILTKFDLKICAKEASFLFLNCFIVTDVPTESFTP